MYRFLSALSFFFIFSLVTGVQAKGGYPRHVWELSFKERIIDQSLADKSNNVAVLTRENVAVYNPYGNQIWKKERDGNYDSIEISANGGTVLLYDNFSSKYRIISRVKRVDNVEHFAEEVVLSSNGENLFAYNIGEQEILVYNLAGIRVDTFRDIGVNIQDVLASPNDDYLLVLGNKNSVRYLNKIFLNGRNPELISNDLSFFSFDELVISSDGSYIGANDRIYDLEELNVSARIKPKVMAISSNGTDYLTIDSRKAKLSFLRRPNDAIIWEKRHFLDQWQEVYLDSNNSYILSLSYLPSAVEYTVQLFNYEGDNLVVWRIDWQENYQIDFTDDLRYVLLNKNNKLIMYQLY